MRSTRSSVLASKVWGRRRRSCFSSSRRKASPGSEAPRHSPWSLHRFLEALPRDVLYAVELRNPELLTSDYLEALASAGACHCFNVHPTMPDVSSQVEQTGRDRFPALVARWMLRHGREYEDARDAFYPFDRIAEPDDGARTTLAGLCRDAVRAKKKAFVIVNNKAEGSAPLSVARLAEEIAAS